MVVAQVIVSSISVRFSTNIYARIDALRKPPITQIKSATPHWDDLFGKMFSGDDLCNFDAVVLVDQPGVRPPSIATLRLPS